MNNTLQKQLEDKFEKVIIIEQPTADGISVKLMSLTAEDTGNRDLSKELADLFLELTDIPIENVLNDKEVIDGRHLNACEITIAINLSTNEFGINNMTLVFGEERGDEIYLEAKIVNHLDELLNITREAENHFNTVEITKPLKEQTYLN